MTEFRDTSRMTARHRRALSVAAAHAGPVIDGTAEVTNRRPLRKSAAEIEAARRDLMPDTANYEPPPCRAYFGQRTPRDFAMPTGSAGRRTEPRDLFSQAFAPSPFVPPAASAVDDRSILTRVKAARLRNVALVVGGFLVGLLAVPALLLSAPQSPIAAPLTDSSHSGLRLRDVAANIAPRGDGAVLSVTGTVANATAMSALLPPLRIALTEDDGTIHARPLRAGVERLAPGQSVRFVSALAIPAEMRGDVSVRFGEAGKARP